MHLVPRELDKLTITSLGQLAQRRLARGVRLNHGEACALVSSVLQELIRDGRHTVADLMSLGSTLLGRRHVLPGVPSTLAEIQVEGTFPTGTYLVTVHGPIATDDGDPARALYGSFLPVPDRSLFPDPDPSACEPAARPGAVVVATREKRKRKGGDGQKQEGKEEDKDDDDDESPPPPLRITLNEGRRRIRLRVTSRGDRPIQVGSHYHFVEANPQLAFDRGRARGFRLDVPAGTSVRFEPGDTRTVTLVAIGGRRVIRGGNGLASGPVDDDAGPGGDGGGTEKTTTESIVERLVAAGFAHEPEPAADAALVQRLMTTTTTTARGGQGQGHGQGLSPSQSQEQQQPAACTMDRAAYRAMFGPTTGDRVRLGATELWVRVERDLTTYGDECKFGGGKTLREGMGQAGGVADGDCLDLVVTNALVVDHTGIFKADVGVKGGRIAAVGKAGNPDVMDGVTPGMVVGSCTDVIAGEGRIVTAGALDTHIHFICPQQADEALASGVTTLLGGGVGPSAGTCATTCTPGAHYMRQMLQACDELPVNVGITGKGNDSEPGPLREQVRAGACGLKLHEDWGSTPAAIDACLGVCDELDVQCLIHTDTLNEAGFVESTVAALRGRTIHTYHTEGAGGGHAPDIIRVVELPNVLPSSTNPTRPFTANTLDEHLDMLMVCHHLSKDIPEDVAFAESRIRAETIAAEDVLHDLGAISMMSSDSQAMGRCGEVVARTWNTAHKNKLQRGPLPEDAAAGRGDDNHRVKRYVSKYTVNPALAQGMAHLVGSVEPGRLADLVVWDPAWFGTKPSLVLKSGLIAYAMMGDPNASIPTVQPILGRPMFARSVPESSVTFVSACSLYGEDWQACLEEEEEEEDDDEDEEEGGTSDDDDNRAARRTRTTRRKGPVAGYGLRKRVEAVRGCRSVGKADMRHNDAMPRMRVDPETYVVEADGVGCVAEPAAELPLAQAYFVY